MTRDHILAEIRRTAAANGGVPLGVARFFAETGIRESDWHGKYWARWGDALKEVGLQPNQLRAAIPEDELLTKLVGLVRGLGHFPVKGELELKKQSDPSFPNPKTFGRFGNKVAQVQRLRDFCLARGENDVADICASIAMPEAVEVEETRPAQPEFGFVYLLKSGRFYKVGCTNAVGRRERELAIQLPERAHVIHSIRTDDPLGIEAYWHRRFGSARRNGEWFELTQAEVTAFKRRKFM